MLIRTLRISFGFLLLATGLVGWLLPIIPGWALVIPGLLLLSREFRWARRLLRWLRSRFPRPSAQGAAAGDLSSNPVGKMDSFRDNKSPRD